MFILKCARNFNALLAKFICNVVIEYTCLNGSKAIEHFRASVSMFGSYSFFDQGAQAFTAFMKVIAFQPKQTNRGANAKSIGEDLLVDERIIHCRQEVAMLILGDADPFGLIGAVQMTLGLFCIFSEVHQMTSEDFIQFVRL